MSIAQELKEIKRSLSRLPQEVKDSPLYARLANDYQRYSRFVHLEGLEMFEEKSVPMNFRVPGIESLYNKGWANWLKYNGPVSEEAVKEFLATMVEMYEENEEGDYEGIGVMGMVNGVQVEITRKEFNHYFDCEITRPEHLKGVDGVEEVEADKAWRIVMARALLKPGDHQLFVHRWNRFNIDAQVVTKVLYNRVYSRDVPMMLWSHQIALVYSVLKPEIVVDLGYHVVKSLMDLVENKERMRELRFPRLITLFSLRAGAMVESFRPDWRFIFSVKRPNDESKWLIEMPERKRARGNESRGTEEPSVVETREEGEFDDGA